MPVLGVYLSDNMAEHHDSEFKAEYAKSNRASCKGCRDGIGKDTLRLALMVQVFADLALFQCLFTNLFTRVYMQKL